MSTSLITSSGGLNKIDKQTVQNWMVEGHSIMNGKIEGTVPDKSNWSATINAGESITIPVGYHNGEGTVTAGKNVLKRKFLFSIYMYRFDNHKPSGTATVTDLPGWQNFTTDNFVAQFNSARANGSGGNSGATVTVALSYNSTTGVVTASFNNPFSGYYSDASVSANIVCFYVD